MISPLFSSSPSFSRSFLLLLLSTLPLLPNPHLLAVAGGFLRETSAGNVGKGNVGLIRRKLFPNSNSRGSIGRNGVGLCDDSESHELWEPSRLYGR